MKILKSGIVAAMCVIFISSFVFGEDIDNMSLEELRAAYAKLESEKEDLEEEVSSLEELNGTMEEEIKDLKVQLFDLQSKDSLPADEETTDIETKDTESAEEVDSEEPVLMTTEEFLEDIEKSYNERSVRTDRYNTSDYNTMNNDEYVETYYYFVEAEEWFYEKYKNAEFEDLNIQYLCKTYCDGLYTQLNCCRDYFNDKDYASWDNNWKAAYNKRSYVIVELAEYYDAPFKDINDMKNNVESLDSLNEAETRNSAVDRATVQKVQLLLNNIGFYCGNADGVSGKRTVKSIKRFQEMYEFEPIDGVIDDELVDQLEKINSEKNPVEITEEEIETTTE